MIRALAIGGERAAEVGFGERGDVVLDAELDRRVVEGLERAIDLAEQIGMLSDTGSAERPPAA